MHHFSHLSWISSRGPLTNCHQTSHHSLPSLHLTKSPNLSFTLPSLIILTETHQENNGGVADEGDGGGELPLVAARVGAGAPVGVRQQAQLLQAPVGNLQGQIFQ